ncbi:Rpn family recombination-promoting nuclease/putative transposase [Lamprobacter modestohalophilus]|uniref:Rpn family recombination-promoting nuclease/putative transposase n=1 Tax=Lamprobacter modestohalophilus TaxID=1064514 RepID=UPI002ADEE7FC|nr:Rpn family recombination-promoting nuclease/putative transposase [Lamprobacter modestohalophilus]MEA1050409.1 Rpn family recombination-promoting nuclease/putative transposase [Lamprobacter modestohalophilus]
MAKHHDTGYKELFSHPEFVQQLIEGFAPAEIASLMDFSTLKNHSGHYITPLFEERFEDVVWSVQVHWQGVTEQLFLYLLIEFQASVDPTMPLRMLHYVACFYQHLLKTKVTSPARGLPPILLIVLYNGLERWHAAEDIDELVRPTPPLFLHAYQPHLRYYLIDEGRYTPEQLSAIDSPLSGVFEVEIASGDRASLQAAVDRLVRLIQADPNKARLDRLITRWLKRHLRRLSADIDLKQINSLVEDKAMLAENLESWAQRERREGRLEGERIGIQKGERIGIQKGERIGMKKTAQATARNRIALGMLNDGQIAQVTGLSVAQVEALRADN